MLKRPLMVNGRRSRLAKLLMLEPVLKDLSSSPALMVVSSSLERMVNSGTLEEMLDKLLSVREEDLSSSTKNRKSTGLLTLVSKKNNLNTMSITRDLRLGTKLRRPARDGVVTSPLSDRVERRPES